MQSRRSCRVSSVLALFFHLTGCDLPDEHDMDNAAEKEVLRAIEQDEDEAWLDEADTPNEPPGESGPTDAAPLKPPGPGDAPAGGTPRPCRPIDIKWSMAYGGTGSPPAPCTK